MSSRKRETIISYLYFLGTFVQNLNNNRNINNYIKRIVVCMIIIIKKNMIIRMKVYHSPPLSDVIVTFLDFFMFPV